MVGNNAWQQNIKEWIEQIFNGKWTSKLGQYEDIEHNALEGLEGSTYGHVACVMKRHFTEQE